ncbi:MAG: choice-of-anchor X domain-containing protein [Promethearchaeota archaeon]
MIFFTILFSNNLNVSATTDFNPDPSPPGTGNEYWDFNEGEKVGWNVKYYSNGSFLSSISFIFNITKCVYEPYNDYSGSDLRYFVKLTPMYYNYTTNQLQIDNYFPQINASAINFTNGVMSPSDYMFYVSPFIHHNGTNIALYWATRALQNNSIYLIYIPNSQISVKGNETWINSTTSKSYVHSIYNSHGILEFGEFFIDFDGIGIGNGNITYIYNRFYDWNILDNVSWGFGIGDKFYTNEMGDYYKYKIVDIINDTQSFSDPMQIVYANRSRWDPHLETWIDDSYNPRAIGYANELYFYANYLIPIGTTGEKLLSGTSSLPFDNVTYGDIWVKGENEDGDFLILKYHSNGLVMYYYFYNSSMDLRVIFYSENISTLTIGRHNITFSPYDFQKDYNITAEIQVNNITDLYYVGTPYCANNTSGLMYTDFFIDMHLNKSASLVGSIKLTITYNTNLTGPFYLWALNGSTHIWESVPISDDGMGTLNATLNHFSIYALCRAQPPESFYLTSNGDHPDRDGDFNLTWYASKDALNYSIYQYNSYITEINGSVTELANGVTNLFYEIEGLGNGIYYYKVISYNPYGNASSNCIRVDVALGPPDPFTLSSDAGDPDSDGVIHLTWTESNGAINYSIYQHDSLITEINGSVTELISGVKQLSYTIQGLTDGTYYYKVISFNKFGNYSSNCIKVNVKRIFLINYTMILNSSFNWIDISGATNINIWDEDTLQFPLPFNFTFYGQNYSSVFISDNGWISFETSDTWYPYSFPTTDYKRLIGVFVEDLDPPSSAGQVYIKNLTSPNRYAIIWDNIDFWNDGNAGTFEIILYQSGLIKLQYLSISNSRDAYCGVNRGEGENYYNYYDNLNSSMVNYTIVFIYGNNTPPILNNEEVIPTSGTESTLFTFKVNYTDAENYAPAFINVVINGTSYSMSKENPLDSDYTDGCIYKYSTYLLPAQYNYTYYFECSDTFIYNSTNIYTNLKVVLGNIFKPNLTNPIVSPSFGNNSILFNFSVWYFDGDNNLPAWITITLNNSISASMVEVDPLDTNVTDGKQYYFNTTLPFGNYKFKINCSDGMYFNSTGWIIGPEVNPFYGAPEISLIDPANDSTIGNGLINFNWTSLNAGFGAVNFTLQISNTTSFTYLYYEVLNIEEKPVYTNYSLLISLNYGDYYWRVRPIYQKYIGNWSEIFTFNIPYTDYPILNWTSVFPPNAIIGTTFNITAELSAKWGLQSVYGWIHYNNGTIRSYLMHDDGAHGDNESGDGIYGMFWNSTNQLIGTYYVSINATDNLGYSIIFYNVTSFNVSATDSNAPIMISSHLNVFLADANFNNSILINCNLWDDSNISKVSAYIYHSNGTLVDIIDLFDDGNHNDNAFNDNKFGNTWYSNYANAGFYYIDIFCNDSYSNSKIYYNELSFILLNWNVSIDETLIYNVTTNNMGPFLNPLSNMPEGTLYRFDLKDIYIYSGLADNVWRIIGDKYYLNNTSYFELLESLRTLIDANISLNYYKDYFFADQPNYLLATLIPTPVCNWTFKWLEDCNVFETFFSASAYTYVYTNDSINIYYTNNPNDVNLTITYNQKGIMTKYYLEYYGDQFEMILIFEDVVQHNGSLSNPQINFITDNNLNFTIIYTNTKNIPPVNVNITINGQVYCMFHNDYNYTDGALFYYQIVLPNGLYSYNFSYFDGNFTEYTQTYKVLVGLHYPTLTDGYFSPLTGNQSTKIMFFVNYTDTDNDAPAYVRVVIDGHPYDMQQQDPFDTDYTNGCIFNKTLILDGNYSYYFICSDGLVKTNTSVKAGPIIEVKNLTPPVLSNQNVSPNPGEVSVQEINFNVTYTDAENNVPIVIVLTLDGKNYTMFKYDPSDFDCTDGIIYHYSLKINSTGLHQYNFTAFDGKYWAYLSSFTVNIIQTNAPTLSGVNITPKTGQYGVTLINFTITYTDPDNNAPSFIFVEIGGINYTMSKVFAGDNDYTDGCLYYYKSAIYNVGNITYQFWASDGIYTCNDGPYNNLEIHAAPILSVAYYSNHVSPNHGEVFITNFWFTIKYTDYDNDAPTFINITINGQSYAMTKQFSDNNYVDGVIYEFFKVFTITGTFEYNFSTSDGVYSLNYSGSWTINVHLTNAPTLTDGKVEPIIGEFGITDFNFTVNCTDLDNDRPEVQLVLEGVSYLMTKLYYNDNDYTDGCIYYIIIKIERLGILQFNFTASDAYYSTKEGPHTLTVQKTNPPTLSGGQVLPNSGDIHSELFNFSVNYVDLDNDPPAYINVIINGSIYSMVKVNPLDTDYTDGCLYYYNTTLDFIGDFTFYFIASDGLYEDTDGNYMGSVIQLTPPTLQNGQVSPTLGEKGVTLFNFTVLYTDLDNLAPVFVRLTLDGNNYSMVKVNPLDMDYTDGCLYYFNTTINTLGTHEYNFTAFNKAHFVFDGTYSNCLVQAGPHLSSPNVNPPIGEQFHRLFNFTVIYTHEQNVAPNFIYITIENVNYSMIKADISDNDYTDGCLYYYTTTLSAVGNRIYNFTAYDGTFYRFYGNFIVQVFPEINWNITLNQDYIWTIKYSESEPELIGSQWIYTPLDINLTALDTSSVYGRLSFMNRSKGYIETIWPYFKIEDYNTLTGLYWYYEATYKEYIFFPFLELPIDLFNVNKSIVNFYFIPEYGLTPTTINIYSSNNSINYEFTDAGTDYRYVFQWNDTGVLELYKRYENGIIKYHIDTFNASLVDLYNSTWIKSIDYDIDYIQGKQIIGTFNISTSAPFEYIQCSTLFQIMDSQANIVITFNRKSFLINNTYNVLIYIYPNITELTNFGDYYFKYSLYYYDGSIEVVTTEWQFAFELEKEIYYKDLGTLNIGNTLNWNAETEFGTYLTIPKSFFAKFSFNLTENCTFIDFNVTSSKFNSYYFKIESKNMIKFETLYFTKEGTITIRIKNLKCGVYNVSLIADNKCELHAFNISATHSSVITEEINFIGVHSSKGFNYFNGLNGSSELFSVEFNYTIVSDQYVVLQIINLTNRAVIAEASEFLRASSSISSHVILITINFPIKPVDTFVEVNLTLLNSNISDANNVRFRCNDTYNDKVESFTFDIIQSISVYEQTEMSPFFWVDKSLKLVDKTDLTALDVSNITILEVFFDKNGKLDNVTIMLKISNKFDLDVFITSYSVCYDVFISPVIKSTGEIGEKRVEMLIGGESETIIVRGVKIRYVDTTPLLDLKIIYRKSLIANLISIGLQKVLPTLLSPLPTFGLEEVALQVMDMVYDMYSHSISQEEMIKFIFRALGESVGFFVAKHFGFEGTTAEAAIFLTEEYQQNLLDLAFDLMAKDNEKIMSITSAVISLIWDFFKDNPEFLANMITKAFACMGKSVSAKIATNNIKNAFKVLSILDIIVDAWIKLNAPDEEIKTIYSSFNEPYPGDFSKKVVSVDPILLVKYNGPTAYSISRLVRLYNILEFNMTNIHWNSTHSYLELSALTHINYTSRLQILFEDPIVRNTLLGIFGPKVDKSYFVKNGSLLKIFAYVNLLNSQTFYSINGSRVICSQEFHFNAIEIEPNHYRFNFTFNYMENETFINLIQLTLPEDVYWIKSNIPYTSWINNIVTWNSNITNLIFEFKIQPAETESEKEENNKGGGEKPPETIFPFLLIIIVGIVAVAGIFGIKKFISKSESEPEFLEKEKQTTPATPSMPIKKEEKGETLKTPLLIKENIKIRVICVNCNKFSFIDKSNYDNFKCENCSSNEYGIIYLCSNCKTTFSMSKEDFLSIKPIERVHQKCPNCNYIAELMYKEDVVKKSQKMEKPSKIAEYVKEEQPAPSPTTEPLKITPPPKEKELEEKTRITPPQIKKSQEDLQKLPTSDKKSYIALLCPRCQKIEVIPKEYMDNFVCTNCMETEYHVLYYCPTCQRNYSISKEDYIKFNKPKLIDCDFCEDKIRLVEK